MQSTQKKRSGDRPSSLQERLQNPVQLRMFLTGSMLLLGYGAIYVPLSDSIANESRLLAAEQKRNQLAISIQRAEREQAKLAQRLPEDTTTSEWMQYLLNGIRKWPLKLHSLDPKPRRRIGPFQVDEFQVELESGFEDLSNFVEWIETNERLFRIDHVKLTPSRNGKSQLVLKLTILALNG